MTAYLVVEIEVKDPDHYQDYVARAPAFVRKHQGRYLVRGGNPEVFEGDWQPERLVVVEFPSKALALGLLEDAEYQALADTRRASTLSKLVLVEGC